MVSFECSQCNDTLKKPKLMGHLQRCRYAQYTCIDCNVTFEGMGFQGHTSCISEDQKYQKSVYKAPKVKNQQNQQQQQQNQQKSIPPHLTSLPTPAATPTPSSAPIPTPTPSTSTVSNGIHPDRQKFLDAAQGNANKKVNNKRGREEPAAVVPVVVVPEVVAVVEEDAKKKEKKEKKKAEKAAKLLAAEAVVAAVEAAVEEKKVEVVVAAEEERPAKKSKKEAKQEKFAKKKSGGEEVVVVVVPAPVVSVVPVHPISIHGVQAAHIPLPPFDLSTLSKPYTLPSFLTAIYPTLLGKSTSFANIRDTVVAEAQKAGFKDEKIVERALMEGVHFGGASLKKIKTMEMKF